MKKEPLSKAEGVMFSDAVERARKRARRAVYQQGMDKVRVQRWQEAASSFEESINTKRTPRSRRRSASGSRRRTGT